MNNKIHIAIEITLVAILVSVVGFVIHIRQDPLEAHIRLKDGDLLTVQSDNRPEAPDVPGIIMIYLNKGSGQTYPIIEFTPASDRYFISMFNKDGHSINAGYDRDGTGPSEVTRGVESEGKNYLVMYNDAGEVEKKVDMHMPAKTASPAKP